VRLTGQDENCDVIVVGAGPAGLTASIYSSWLGLKTMVLETGVSGGRAWQVPRIENFPGFEDGISGRELADRMNRQTTRLGTEVRVSEEVVGLDVDGGVKKVTTRKKTYLAAAVVICTGTQRRKLHVPGEEEFLGRGVSYCAVCDGAFFRNAEVAVVGKDQEAVTDALFLSDIAKSVTVVTQEKDSEIEEDLKEKLEKPNVHIVNGQLLAILGDEVVKSMKILESDGQRESEREVKGVFIALGGVPMTELVRRAGIVTDRNGCLIVDRMQRTNVEGVYAAGDCTCGGMQVVTAAGEGAMAAMKASAYIRGTKPRNQTVHTQR
jgi:thioredoxin reductase (NADPH)